MTCANFAVVGIVVAVAATSVLGQAEARAKTAELLKIVGQNKEFLNHCFQIEGIVYEESLL